MRGSHITFPTVSNVSLPSLFSDRMVLQRDKPNNPDCNLQHSQAARFPLPRRQLENDNRNSK